MSYGEVKNVYRVQESATPDIKISFGVGTFQLMNMSLRGTNTDIKGAAAGLLGYYFTESDGTEMFFSVHDGYFNYRNDLVWVGNIHVKGPGNWNCSAALKASAPVRFHVGYRKLLP